MYVLTEKAVSKAEVTTAYTNTVVEIKNTNTITLDLKTLLFRTCTIFQWKSLYYKAVRLILTTKNYHKECILTMRISNQILHTTNIMSATLNTTKNLQPVAFWFSKLQYMLSYQL